MWYTVVPIDSFTYGLQTPDLCICNLGLNAKLNLPPYYPLFMIKKIVYISDMGFLRSNNKFPPFEVGMNSLFFLKAKKIYYFILFYVFCVYFEKYATYQKSVLMKMYQNRRVSPICTTCEPLKNSVFVLKAKKNIILCIFW